MWSGVGKKEAEQEDALKRHASLNLDSRPCFRWLFRHMLLPPHSLQVFVTVVRWHLAKYQLQRISNKERAGVHHMSAYVSIRQQTSANASIRQHMLAYCFILDQRPCVRVRGGPRLLVL